MILANKKRYTLIAISLIVILAMTMLFAVLGIIFDENKKADAITSSNITTQSTNLGEMLLNGYENDLTGKGYVFDKEIFWELIRQISNGTVTDKSGLSTLGTRTSADFRSYNGNKDVVVTIGEKQWIATYLSQNSSSDPILTLWLANSNEAVPWTENKTNSNGNYPSNMYGTSSVRAVTLNNGGGYAVNYNDTSLKSVTQDTKNEWARYTMTKEQGVSESLTEFIEVPDNMSWQHTQSAKASAGQSNDFNNDALDAGGNGNSGSYLAKTGYKNWAKDRLWLPSIAETGVSGVSGIWKASINTRANINYSWVRSANNLHYGQAHLLNANGNGIDQSGAEYVLRPAFHLNLAKAEQYTATVLENATQLSSIYNGEQQDYFNADGASSWYDATLFASDKANVKVEYSTSSGGALSTPKPIEQGTYKVHLTIQSDEYVWTGGKLTLEQEIDFTINQKVLNVNFDPSTTPPKV
ncbi:MAG: hypothetical protein K2K85_08010, partial [Clostridia bacterium]|nr:hypothetical protein [Clostridia bacterium]